jgi:Ca-activated chloride channel family protein
MKRTSIKKMFLSTSLASVLVTAPAWADESQLPTELQTAASSAVDAAQPPRRSSINDGTQALMDGNPDEAIAHYQAVPCESTDPSMLAYNQAVAHYRKGETATAEALFQDALNSDADEQLAAKSHFNLGNCDYSRALEQRELDRPATIESLRAAIDDYRSALRMNREDIDARANIELANKLIRELEKEEKQEQEQQDQEQQDSDSS